MSVMKVYSGTAWETPYFRYPKIWDGTNWVLARPTVWTDTGAWSGLSSSDSSTVTVGTLTYTIPYSATYTYYGYDLTTGFYNTPYGSITNPDLSIADEAYVYAANYEIVSTGAYYVNFILRSKHDPNIVYENVGWTTLTIGSYSYNRTDATFSVDSSGGFSSAAWSWTTTSTNPFGTTVGATKTVSWA